MAAVRMTALTCCDKAEDWHQATSSEQTAWRAAFEISSPHRLLRFAPLARPFVCFARCCARNRAAQPTERAKITRHTDRSLCRGPVTRGLDTTAAGTRRCRLVPAAVLMNDLLLWLLTLVLYM